MKQLANGRWQVRWRDSAHHQRSRNFRLKEQAQKFQREVWAGLQEDKKPEVVTFRSFAARWHRDYCLVEKSLTQHIDDPRTIGKYLLPAFGDKTLEGLKPTDLLELRGRLKDEGRLSDKSINLIVSLGRSMMEVAVDWQLVDANPFRRIAPISLPEVHLQFWTIEERERFLAYARREDPAFAELVEFACHTGLRIGELRGLCRDAIDFGRQTLLVQRSWNKTAGRMVETTKSRRIRVVPLNEAAMRIAKTRRLLAPKEPIFTIDPGHVSRQLRRLAQRAGVKELRFHDLRHTFASQLRRARVPIDRIQALLGHQDIRQTMHYAKLYPDDLRGVTDGLCVRLEDSEGSGGKSTENHGGNWWGHTDLNHAQTKKKRRVK